MSTYNLMDEPWIPVAVGGSLRVVSIREALRNALALGDVQTASPLETAALVRLLLAVLHAACGPKDWKDTGTLLRAGKFPEETMNSYLDQWRPQFDLFGERPFLQIGTLTMAQETPLAALATAAATGNNATLFDHTQDDDPPAFTPAEAARTLLAAQGFALGFGRAADATIGGQPFPRPYLADGICLRGVTLWLSGKSLFETLVLNLVPGTAKDKPLWERDNPLERLDRVVDGKRVAVRSQSPMERYVWQSRLVRLLPETDAAGQTVVRRAYFTQGREADKSPGDPMKVFVESKTEGIYALGLNAGKASWRDLHSLMAFSDKVPRPAILSHAARLVENAVIPKSVSYNLNVVGLATDPGKAGKFLLWRHDRLSIPAALLEDVDLVELLGTLLSDAEFVAGELRGRTYKVAKGFVPPHGNPDPKDVAHLADALDARPAFWARLENHFMALLTALPNDEQGATEQWRKQVAQEAEWALRESCRQLGQTPPAMRARAAASFHFEADEDAVKRRFAESKKRRRPNVSASPTEKIEKKLAGQPNIDGLVNWLHRQASDADKISSARTALAELRRGLRDDPRDRLIVGRYVVRFLGTEPQTDWQRWQEQCCYLVAALFASHPAKEPTIGLTLGAALEKIKGESGSIEGRFLNLLSVRSDRLRDPLRQIVSLLAARGIPLDWRLLLRDLSHWDDPEKRVQQRWARHFYQGPYDPELDQIDPMNGEKTDED